MAASISITVKGITETYESPLTDDETIEVLENFIIDTLDPIPPEADTAAKVARFKLQHAVRELGLYVRRKAVQNAERKGEAQIEAIREGIRNKNNF